MANLQSRRGAHDIRSPLSALNMVAGNADSLPENDRIIVRSAVARINDIANNLTSAHLPISSQLVSDVRCSAIALGAELLSSVIESIVSEKRAQLCARPALEIVSIIGPQAYGLFGRLEASQFKRVLSNIINNAVEAIEDEAGKVEISLVSKASDALITVSDSGKGIPADVLPKLAEKGFSSGKAHGSGLGLYSAKEIIESWGGKLNISSEAGRGTSVCIQVKLAKPPFWYVPALIVPSGGTVAILDDDQSIHHVGIDAFQMLVSAIPLSIWCILQPETSLHCGLVRTVQTFLIS